MRLETTAGQLRSSLEVAARVIGRRRQSLPILQCVLIEDAHVVATNLDIDVRIPLVAKKAEGRAAISFWPLIDLARQIPADENVILIADAEGAQLAFSAGRYDLAIYPADMPAINASSTIPVECDGDRLKKAMAFASVAISTEETRYYLNGICIDAAFAVATNGHQLAAHPLGFDGSAFNRAIIPADLVRLLLTLPAPSKVAIGECRIALEAGGVSIAAKTIDGSFPDWSRVVPGHNTLGASIEVAPKSLLSALKRMTAISAGSMSAVTLSYDESGVAATIKSDHGTAREFVAHATPRNADKPAAITFNNGYLRIGLNRFPSAEKIGVTFSADRGPVLIADAATESDSERPFFLLMPIRHDDDTLAFATLAEWNALRRAAA